MPIDFTIGKGDRLPDLVVTPTRADGTVVDISTATAPKFYFGTVQKTATIFQDTDNVYKLKYPWAAGDTDVAGQTNCYFTVTFGGSLPERFPNNDYILVEVFDGGLGVILTTKADYASMVSITGVSVSDFSFDDFKSIGFLQSAESKIMDTLEAQPGYGTTVPTVAQIMAGTGLATPRDKTHLQASVLYQLAYLFGPGEANSVDVSQQIGPVQRDLGGLGETWVRQMEEYQIQCDYHICKITGFKKWRTLA